MMERARVPRSCWIGANYPSNSFQANVLITQATLEVSSNRRIGYIKEYKKRWRSVQIVHAEISE